MWIPVRLDVLTSFNIRKSTLSEYLTCELWRASSMIFKVDKTLIFKNQQCWEHCLICLVQNSSRVLTTTSEIIGHSVMISRQNSFNDFFSETWRNFKLRILHNTVKTIWIWYILKNDGRKIYIFCSELLYFCKVGTSCVYSKDTLIHNLLSWADVL